MGGSTVQTYKDSGQSDREPSSAGVTLLSLWLFLVNFSVLVVGASKSRFKSHMGQSPSLSLFFRCLSYYFYYKFSKFGSSLLQPLLSGKIIIMVVDYVNKLSVATKSVQMSHNPSLPW